MPTVHAEFTYFYYPGDFVFPRELREIFFANKIIQMSFIFSAAIKVLRLSESRSGSF